MLGRPRSGFRDARAGASVRRLAIAVVASAQLAIIAVAPLADSPPAPAGHVLHFAAETEPGCQPIHDEHCVVCRVLSTEAVGIPAEAQLAPCPPVLPLSPLAASASLHPGGPFDRLHARAPPIA